MVEDFSSTRQTLRKVNPESIDQERAEQAARLRTRNKVTRTKSVEESELLLGKMRLGLRKGRRPEKPGNNGDSANSSDTGNDPKCPWGEKARAPPSQHLQNLLAWDQKHAERAAARVYSRNTGNDGSGRPKLTRRNSESNFVGILANARKNLRHVKRQPYVPPLPWKEFVALRKTNYQKGPNKSNWEMEKVLLRKAHRPQRRHSFPLGPNIQLKKTLMHQTDPPQVQLKKVNVAEESQNETELTEVLSEDDMTHEKATPVEDDPVVEEAPMLEEGALSDEEEVQDTEEKEVVDDLDESKRQLEEKLAEQQQRLAQVQARGYSREKLLEEISVEKARDILMWYARLDQPDKETMKRKVKKLPYGCDITVDDVDILPWIYKDRMLDITEMTKLFLQGGLS